MQELCILHVTPYSGDAWAYGGIPRLSHAMARSLADRGHRVTICTTDACDADRRLTAPDGVSRFGAWRPVTSSDRITVRVFPNISNRLAYHQQVFAPIGMRRFLRKHALSFDVAHLHACRNLPGVFAARSLRDAGVPYVLAPNGTAPRIERRRFVKRLFDAAWGNDVTRHAHRVLAVTEAERRQLHEAGVADDRIRLVANPIDLVEFSTPPVPGAFKARHGLSGPLVVYLGKITPRKRVHTLVRAFAQLRSSDAAPATLVIAGNDMGAGAAARAAAEDAGVMGRTRFVGLLQGTERLELLADADVVVYPSEHEIFGLVPLEALLVGTPVVVSDDSGCGEVVRQVGGGLVVPGREADLARAIETVMGRPDEWRAAARAAAVDVRARFGAETIGARLEELYAEVMRSQCRH
jgi:glycosyltransferase involved in cell wall biosynthesis